MHNDVTQNRTSLLSNSLKGKELDYKGSYLVKEDYIITDSNNPLNLDEKREIILQNYTLSANESEQLCRELTAGNIQKLSLSGIHFAQEEIFTELCQAISKSQLVELNILNCKLNQLPNKQWELLCDAIAYSPIKNLDLRGNNLSNISEDRLCYLHNSIKRSEVVNITRDSYLDPVKVIHIKANTNESKPFPSSPTVINPSLEKYNDELLLYIEANRSYQKITDLTGSKPSKTDLKRLVEGQVINDRDLALVVLKHPYLEDKELSRAVVEVIKERSYLTRELGKDLPRLDYLYYEQIENNLNMTDSIYHCIANQALYNDKFIQEAAKILDTFCQISYEEGNFSSQTQKASLASTSYATKIAMQNPAGKKSHLLKEYCQIISEYLTSYGSTVSEEPNAIESRDLKIIKASFDLLSQGAPKILDEIINKYALKVYEDHVSKVTSSQKSK